MSAFYLLIADQKQGPFDMGEMHRMWSEGSIRGETLYRKEGLEEWLPVGPLLEGTPTNAGIRRMAALDRTKDDAVEERDSRRAITVGIGGAALVGVVIVGGLVWLWVSTNFRPFGF